jgi:hypothetical protein
MEMSQEERPLLWENTKCVGPIPHNFLELFFWHFNHQNQCTLQLVRIRCGAHLYSELALSQKLFGIAHMHIFDLILWPHRILTFPPGPSWARSMKLIQHSTPPVCFVEKSTTHYSVRLLPSTNFVRTSTSTNKYECSQVTCIWFLKKFSAPKQWLHGYVKSKIFTNSRANSVNSMDAITVLPENISIYIYKTRPDISIPLTFQNTDEHILHLQDPSVYMYKK